MECVPLPAFGAWEHDAAAVTAAWERNLLLIEIMPARPRDVARAGLQHAMTAGLIGAAANGVDVQGRPDVGF